MGVMVVSAWLRMARALAAVVMVFSCVVFVGCAGSSSSSSADSQQSQEASSNASSLASTSASSSALSSASSEFVFGEKTSTARHIEIVNETGFVVTSMTANPPGAQGSPTQLMATGDALPAGKTATVYFESADLQTVDIAFLCDGASYQLHNVDLMNLSKAEIHTEGDVAYLVYEQGGASVNTLNEERNIMHPPAAESEAVAREEQVEYYEDVAVEEAPAQQEDACVTDIILN